MAEGGVGIWNPGDEAGRARLPARHPRENDDRIIGAGHCVVARHRAPASPPVESPHECKSRHRSTAARPAPLAGMAGRRRDGTARTAAMVVAARSEEHTSELQSLMRNSYAVF